MAKHRLLVADDSVTIQKVVNLTFADDSFEVVTVSDGDAAIATVYESAPDIVLADISMPGLNGFQVCETIKSNPNFNRIPIILLVGSFENFNKEEAKRVGANDYLTKPFQSIRELVDKVSMLLKNPQTQNITSADTENQPVETAEKSSEDVSDEQEKFGDTGMDDEMIQTEEFQTSAFDESHKYEIAQTESLQESPSDEQTSDIHFSDTLEIKTDDLISERRDENTQTHLENRQTEEEPQQFAENLEENISQTYDSEDYAENANPESVEVVQKTQTGEEIHRSFEHNEENLDNQYQQKTMESSTLSPEEINMIADRVIEKLSDKIVKEVAAKISPQIGEIIVKKMFEEKIQD